ncbi:30S ribosomal protein S6 [Clostridiales bacterium PH28_bin88]|nr:30S ribosomal protein S6 [Clostridiales bacterium PH28_bin88]
MRTYETLFIVRPDLEPEQTAAVVEKFSGLITNNGGQLVKVDQWGKRRLAYEVNDFREGFYVLVQFQSNPEVAQELERIFKITDEIMKYLITRIDEVAS